MEHVHVHEQDVVNAGVYHRDGVARVYTQTSLTRMEAAALAKYRGWFENRDVLDVGVGTGRTTRHLAPLARHNLAIDYSPVMVRYMKDAFAGVSVALADMRDLGAFGSGSFDVVFAPNNVFDAVDHDGRLRAFSEAWRVLRPGGLLAFSSHNL